MISNLDGTSQIFLANVNRIEQRLADTNRQISSGLKISQPSDAPDQLAPLLQLHADEAHNQQIESNLTLAQSEAQAADSTLASAIQLMDRAVTLGTQGATSTLDDSSRQSLAQEVQSLEQQMVSYSQTTVQGRFIFSGDQDTQPSYAYDASATDGVDQLQTVTATRQVEDPAGGSFTPGESAQNIFDHRNADGTTATDNVFAALSGLVTALQSNDPQSIQQAVSNIEAASSHLNTAEAFYGTVENRIQDGQTFASQYDTQLQTQISQKQDADVAAEAIQLTQAQTQLQAAFQMQAEMPRETLFKYLG
jgi:flagellar hook-associated protein 3 FlgL